MTSVLLLLFALGVLGLLTWAGICLSAIENHLKRPPSCRCVRSGEAE